VTANPNDNLKASPLMRHRHHEHEHEHHQHEQGRDRGEFAFGRHGGGPRGRGPRTRRGDIRFALLSALTDGPAHGYELIQRLEDRTGGRWKPSPGSVYPTLQMMEEGGLVTGSQQEEKRVYSLTPAGQAALDERLTEGPLPWMNPEAAEGHGAFRQALGQLVMAAKQVANSGNPQLIESAATILNDARRKLYQLLAEA
jgi:DNA-binding PadR family transcriptional regulator